MEARAHRRRTVAAAWTVAIVTIAFAALGAWNPDSSCLGMNAPNGLTDYVDWWQGCAAHGVTGGWPRLNGAMPACYPRQWMTTGGACVALSCVPGAELIAPCGGVVPRTDYRLAAVRLDERGCETIVATPVGLRSQHVAPERLACSRVVRALGARLPMPNIDEVPYRWWPVGPGP